MTCSDPISLPPYLDVIGPALRQLRVAAGLTQEGLAARARITASMVSNYERGKELPSLRTLFSLVDALDVGAAGFGRELDRLRQPGKEAALIQHTVRETVGHCLDELLRRGCLTPPPR